MKMAVQQTKSSFAAKMGNRLDTVIKTHAGDETDYGFSRLPPGISNGIAQLTKCYFQEHPAGHKQAGKYFWRAEATVISPEFVNVNGADIKVAGRTTSQIIGIYDIKSNVGTPEEKVTPEAEQIASVMNEMRKLGGDTSEITTAAQLEALATALATHMPYFRFSTSVRKARKQGETDGVWENWNGSQGLENYAEQQANYAAMGVVDNSPPAAEQPASPPPTAKPTNGAAKPATAAKPAATPAASAKAPAKPAAGPAKPAPAPVAPPPPATPEELPTDVHELLPLANKKHAAAQRAIRDAALSLGCDEAEVDAATTWEDVVAMIDAAPGNNEAASSEQTATDDFVPKKGEVYGYFPTDPKTGDKLDKKIEVEVLVVNESGRTIDLKNMENKKTVYKGVSFDDLVSAD